MPAAKKTTSRKSTAKKPASSKTTGKQGSSAAAGGDGLANLVEQLVGSVIKPLGLVVLTRERIQETLDEAAERGRVTRADANELVAELVRRGRQQTDDLRADVERMLGRGRGQLGSATKQSVDKLGRAAPTARAGRWASVQRSRSSATTSSPPARSPAASTV